MFGRRLHGETGRVLFGRRPDYTALELYQPGREAPGGVVHFLRDRRLWAGGGLQQRAVCGRGDRLEPAVEKTGPEPQETGRGASPTPAGDVSTQDPSLY